MSNLKFLSKQQKIYRFEILKARGSSPVPIYATTPRNTPIATSKQVESLKNIKTDTDLIRATGGLHNPPFRLTQEQSDQIYREKAKDAVLIQLNPFGEQIFVKNKLRWTFYWDDPIEQEHRQNEEIINFVKSCNAKGELAHLAGKLIFDPRAGAPEFLQIGTHFSKSRQS